MKRSFKFTSVSIIEADDCDHAKRIFADNSSNFAANAKCEETHSKKEFFEKYMPLSNPSSKHALFDGKMFNSFGEDLAFVNIYTDKNVWTITENEKDEIFVIAGNHCINRVGYFITKEEWENPKETYKF